MNEKPDLRDARLKKALDSAPDADARPTAAARGAILHKARLSAAAHRPAGRSWWRSFLPSLGRPWNSGLVTLGVVAFVGVLVWRHDLWKQADTRPGATLPVEASQPAAVLQPRAPVVETPVPASMPMPRTLQSDAPRQVLPSPENKLKAPPPVSVPDTVVAAKPAPEPAPAPAPAPAAVSLRMPAPPVQSAPGPLAATAAASPPADNAIEARSAAVGAPPWTALRITTSSGPVLLVREGLASETQALVQQQLAGLAAPGALSASRPQRGDILPLPVLQVEVLAGERSLVRLELGPGELRRRLEAALAR